MVAPDPPVGALPAVIWVVAGPTASGKTEVALEMATPLGAEVVGADARQVYRGLRVGSGQPDPAARARVPHHLVDLVDPLRVYTAADYARDGRVVLADLAARGVTPLVTGGSGLYLRALLEGLFSGPGRDPGLRARLEARADQEGEGALHAELAGLDPQAAGRLHPRDRVRVIRALEVALLTGRPLSAHHTRHRRRLVSLMPRTRYLVLDRRHDDLDRRIDERVAAMFAGGLLEEARTLLARGLAETHPVCRTLGFRQAFQVLREETPVARAVEATRVATRRYARRQLTWFRGVREARWLPVAPGESAGSVAARALATATPQDA